jgi:acyl-CoA thioester hydrolase
MPEGICHEIKVRVRYADTDNMQVVYYANYFVWFESGRIELLRSKGIVYRDLEKMGRFIPVVETAASYKAPARFDDELVIRTWVSKLGNSSMRFEYEVYKIPERELLCAGHSVHVHTDAQGRPQRIPEELRAKLSP